MYESNKKELDKLYAEDHEYIDRHFNEFVKRMDYSIRKRKNKDGNVLDNLGIGEDRDKFYLVFIGLLLVIFGAIMILPFHPENFLMYLFGFVFFIAGFAVAILADDVKGAGLIFYFSHGGTGFGVMVGALLMNRINTTIFTDLNLNLKIYLGIIIGLISIGVLGGIVYNLSDDLKLNKYNKVILLAVLSVAIVMIGFLPYVGF